MTSIKQLLSNATEVLSDGQHNAISLLKEAEDNCSELSEVLEDAESVFEEADVEAITDEN